MCWRLCMQTQLTSKLTYSHLLTNSLTRSFAFTPSLTHSPHTHTHIHIHLLTRCFVFETTKTVTLANLLTAAVMMNEIYRHTHTHAHTHIYTITQCPCRCVVVILLRYLFFIMSMWSVWASVGAMKAGVVICSDWASVSFLDYMSMYEFVEYEYLV